METNISKIFKETRLALGKSQEEFADDLGCSRVSISLYETGKTQPRAEIYAKVLQLRELSQKQTGKGAINQT